MDSGYHFNGLNKPSICVSKVANQLIKTLGNQPGGGELSRGQREARGEQGQRTSSVGSQPVTKHGCTERPEREREKPEAEGSEEEPERL